MRTNNKLAMAVAAALFSLSAANSAFAVSGLINLNNTATLPDLVGGNTADIASFSTGGTPTGGTPTGTLAVAADYAVATGTIPAEDGIVYASELFGTSPSALPAGTTIFAGAVYTIDGAIDEDFFLTFTLSGGATFSEAVTLYTNTNSGALDAGSLPTSPTSTSSNNKVKFNIKVVDGQKVDANSSFLLKYKLENTADALGISGGKITMDVSPTSVGPTPYIVNVADSVTVAQSAQAVKIEVKPVEFVNAKIATSVGSTEFSNTITTESEAVYVATNQVWLGNIVITHDATAMNDDAQTAFVLGAAGGQVAEAKINISDGQFAASITDPGGIKLIDADSGAELGAIVEVSDDGTGATIDITDILTTMIDIDPVVTTATPPEDDDLVKTTNLMLVVDGITEINIPENAPCATLTIDYDGTNIADVAVPDDGNCVTLPKIQQDGTICWVNIIPQADAVNDKLSILITNNGVTEGELMGTMYGQDGSTLFTAQALADSTGNTILGAGKTMRLAPADLAKLMDGATSDSPGTWAGRSVLKIATIVPDIEILALIRDVNSNINSNTSQGAAGASCTSN